MWEIIFDPRIVVIRRTWLFRRKKRLSIKKVKDKVTMGKEARKHLANSHEQQ